MAKSSRKGGGFGKFVLGFIVAVVLAGAAMFVYFRYGAPPVAVSDPPFPFEKNIVQLPLNARIDREIKTPPFGISEDVFEGGARVYHQQCAACHGTPAQSSEFAAHMYPVAPQLWKKHGHSGVVGVSDDQAGETFWKVSNGIRLTGMPSYSHVLSETQMWQVSLLLKNADQQLPDPVMQVLNGTKP